MAPPVAPLPDELVEEILLLSPPPPDAPASLVRAAAVCKSWCRIVSDPGFSRRFRRAPSTLGVFCNSSVVVQRHGRGRAAAARNVARFVRTATSCPPVPDRCVSRVIDARHGRVLVEYTADDGTAPLHELPLVVWDPFADEQRQLPELPLYRESRVWNAAVLCPSADSRRRRLDPFLVVFVGIVDCGEDRVARVRLCTYSSDATAWSEPAQFNAWHLSTPHDVVGPSLLLGDVLHFTAGRQILRYDLRGRVFSAVTAPFPDTANIGLVTLEKGGIGAPARGGHGCSIRQGVEAARGENLGLGTVAARGGDLHVWAYDGRGGWVGGSRVIRLDVTGLRVLAFAEDAGTVLVSADDGGIFMVELETGRTRKVCDTESHHLHSIVPYSRLYLPPSTSLLVPTQK